MGDFPREFAEPRKIAARSLMPLSSLWSLRFSRYSCLAVAVMVPARSFSPSAFFWNSPTVLRHPASYSPSRLFSVRSDLIGAFM